MFKRLIATILASTMALTSVPVDTVLGGLQDVSVEAEDTAGSTEFVDQDSSEEFGTEEGVTETNEENNETEESWEKQARKVAEARVKASLVLQTLAVEQKITVSDDLVAAKIAELRDVYKKSPEALKNLKDPNVKMDIRNRMVIEKTLDFLVKENS